MPALPSTAQLHQLISRSATGPNTTVATTPPVLQVVCAFPLSGQYGPGTRFLYYLLIAACVFARKAAWLRKACLAAALLFPAVAALHGIVLACVHRNGAVDMDIFGAFQLCAIGILAGPVTVRLSRTYFNDPGRNTIFLWTLLILAGLLSLTVEFFRVHTSPCPFDFNGEPTSPNPKLWNYDLGTNCSLTCTIPDGPFSPIRKGSQNNIYVIPAPQHLTFGTATLLAAGCCIPAILSWVSMWNKVLEVNWKSRFGNQHEDERAPLEGTNGATLETMTKVNRFVRRLLNVVEVPVFGGAVLLILTLGERNFFSDQVYWQTEPISAVGQWAPLVGTVLAVLASLSLFITRGVGMEEVKREETPDDPTLRPRPSMQEVRRDSSPPEPNSVTIPGSLDLSTRRARTFSDGDRARHHPADLTSPLHRAATMDDKGNRRRIAQVFLAIGDKLGSASADQFDDSEFKHGKALDFPEIPGEENRNKDLNRIRGRYNIDAGRERSRSRAGSFSGSIASGVGGEDRSISRVPSLGKLPRAITMPAETSSELNHKSSIDSNGQRLARRDTLDVPSPVHFGHTRNNSSGSSSGPFVARPENTGPPAIVVIPDPDESALADS